MLYGTEVLGATVLGGPPASYAVPSPFSLLIRDPEAERVLLVELTLYDPDTAGETTVLVGSPEASFSSAFYASALKSELVFRQTLFGGEQGPLDAGRGSVSAGDIVLSNIPEKPAEDGEVSEGPFDSIIQDFPDGRLVRILLGRPTFDLSEFGEIFRGKIEDIVWTEDEIRVVIRSPEVILDQPVRTAAFAGTGLLEGGEDLKDALHPICVGEPKLVQPVLVDPGANIYRVHGGSAQDLSVAYDGLAPLTYDGNLAPATALYGWAEVPGHFISSIADGFIRTGNPPAFKLTLSPQGDDGGSLGYVSALGDVCRRLLTWEGDVTDADLDLSAFEVLNALYPGPVGAYTGTDAVSRRQLIDDELLAPLLARLTYTADGLITVGVLREVPPSATIATDDLAEPPKSVRTRPPAWQHRIGYGRGYTPHSGAEIAEAATSALRDFAERPYRFATAESATILTRRKLSRPRDVGTVLQSSAHASAEASRSLTLLGTDRVQYDLVVKNHQFRLSAGQRILVVYPRWGLSLGKPFWILRREERTETKQTHLRVWG